MRRPLRWLATAAGIAVLLGPLALPADADDAGTGREYAGITSSTTGLTVVVDDRTFSPDVLDYDHKVLTVTGRVRLYQPATGIYLGHSGGEVVLGVPLASTRAAVAEDGTFAVSLPVGVLVDDLPPVAWLRWVPDAATQAAFGEPYPTGATIAEWPVPVTATTFRFLPDRAAVTVKEGAAATVSGTLQRLVGDLWQPAPDVGLVIRTSLALAAGVPRHLTEVTDGDGRATFLVPFGADGAGKIYLGDPYAALARPGLVLAVVQADVIPRSTLRWTGHAINRYGMLDVIGSVTTDLSSVPAQDVTIRLQQSRDGRSGWTTVGRTYAYLYEDEGYDGSGTFRDSIHVTHPSWYFRLSFAGTSSVQGSSTAAIRTTRRESRIVRLSVSSRAVDRGDTIVLRGVLQRHTATGWAGIGARTRVYAVFMPRHGNPNRLEYWQVPGTWTKTTGAFAIKQDAWEDGWWLVEWFSTDKHLVGTRSTWLYVDVS